MTACWPLKVSHTTSSTGGENQWLPAKPPTAWGGEYPTLTYDANCPQRLHNWLSEQTFLYQWTEGVSKEEDYQNVNVA